MGRRDERSRSPRAKPSSARNGVGSPRKAPRKNAVDHETVTPSLLRIFYQFGGHHSLSAFATRGREPADEELQVYVWLDVTLGELVDLVQDVLPDTRDAKKLHVNLVYPDKTGKMVFYEIGEVGNGGSVDQKTLEEVKIQTGDFLDFAIY